MSAHFKILRRGISVHDLQLGLCRNPQLWDKHPERTKDSASPHREVRDIWARFAPSWEEGRQAHHSVWLEASELMPAIRQHARSIMTLVGGDELGGVLITKIPPGGRVYPHVDRGWHSTYYDKFLLQVEAHPQQTFCYADGQTITAPGDLCWFYNQEEHWVENNSPVDRISMIVCIKLDKPFGGE